MGKTLIIFVFFVCLQLPTFLQAQVSHGGQPLPFVTTKSAGADLFVEMPAFDIAEQLRIDSLNDTGLKGGYHFAYKFITNYTPENSGIHFTTTDGTRVWRLGIHSANALTLNILFSEYELPEGARLFLYNADQTQVLGAFNYLNNSERNILPVSPVKGDKLIIEYQEPANADFRGKLTVGEVNHGYRDFKSASEPLPDMPAFSCMPPLACYEQQTDIYNHIGHSVVLLIINGELLCTGTLINNTSAEKKPYLLTASHCLNNNFSIKNPDYEEIAGNIICFFNYNSPLCKTVMRGTEEMSTASAHYRAVNEQTDMALLELQETPPCYYQPYYSGWNAQDAGEAPYSGIHHPLGSVKRISLYDKTPALSNFYSKALDFLEKNFWRIDKWTAGATAGGSSGSPLYDANNRVIGALTGGDPYSSCSNPVEDYYYALCKSWQPSDETNKQLKYWLNPGNNEQLICDGTDPYAAQPCFRLSNIRENGKVDAIEATLLPSGENEYQFGTNSSGTTDYAEAYKINGKAMLYGTYMVNPSISAKENLQVEINVYEDSNGKPGNILHTEVFNPVFLYKNNTTNDFQNSIKPLNRDQESFIPFTKEVYVENSFFIGYKITATGHATFAVFNLAKGETTHNTAWVKYNNEWIEAKSHPLQAFSTSLFIDPVIQYTSSTDNEIVTLKNPVQIFVGAERRTIHILLPDDIHNARLSLFSIDGKNIRDWSITEQQATLQIGSIPPGVYIVKVASDNKLYTQKILF